MKIILEPTNSFETFKGVQFRLFAGKTREVAVQMLGMFRITNAIERGKFAAELADAVASMQSSVTPLIAAGSLITGAEGAHMKRREMLAKALCSMWARGGETTEGAWSEFLPGADKLLSEMEKTR